LTRDITESKRAENALKDSERRFRAAFDNASIGASMVDLKGQFVRVNRRLCEMIGYTEEELLGKTFNDVTHPEDMQIGLDYLKRMISGEVDFASFEKRYLHKDGHVINIIVSPSLLRDEDGEPKYFVGLFQDITERKRVEENLKLFSRAVDEAADGIQIVDLNGHVVYSNKAVEDIYGYSPEEYRGMHVNEMNVDPEFAGKEILPGIMKTGQWIGEIMVKHKDGSAFPILLSTSMVTGSKGEPIAMVGVIKDITELKRLEDQLRHSQKMEAVGTLTAGISHEFFNVLTAIRGAAEFLEEETEKESPERVYIDVIQTSIEKATRLTQSLLAYSRKQIVNMQPISVNNIATRAEMLISTLKTENITLEFLLKDEGLSVMADGDQLEQVLMNLAVNAVDAMPDGGTLTISTEPVVIRKPEEKYANLTAGRYVLITVSDTGEGMEKKTQEKIFEPFFTTKDVGKGTGLGLSVAYGIIEKHKGNINVHSKPGKGTTFKIHLPLIRRISTNNP
jgi:PAS domain S-box-containing protein